MAGITAMVVAMALLPAVDALSKLLTDSFGAGQITWMRNACHAAIILPLAVYRHGLKDLRAAFNRRQVMRAAAFVSTTGLYIGGLKYMPLAEALAIIFLYPLLITVAAGAFLGERVGPYRWLAVLVGFAGVCLVVRPGVEVVNPGALLVFAAMVLSVVYILSTRQMAGAAPDLVLLAWPATLGTVMLSPFAVADWTTPDPASLFILVVIGALAALVHLLLIVAYTRAEASAIAPLAYLQIVVGASLGYLMFGDLPDVFSWTGIFLIVAAGLTIMLRERRAVGGIGVHPTRHDRGQDGRGRA